MTRRMTARRRAPNKTEKIACCLLRIKEEDGTWLIPEPLRSTGTAEMINAYVEWHHNVLHALGGDTRPQNIIPLTVEAHKKRTQGPSKATSAGGDIHAAAHSKRLRRKEAEFQARLLENHGGEAPPVRKAKAPFPGGKGSRLKAGFGGKITDRETGEVVREGRK